MPTIEIVNTQQTLQMGTHAEKLQQTMQQLPSTTAQQIQEEQVAVNELKQIEVQDPEKIEATDSTNPEAKRRREIRLRNKLKQNNDLEKLLPNSTQDNVFKGDSHQGQNINLTV
jgi:uncharacterized protein YkwD